MTLVKRQHRDRVRFGYVVCASVLLLFCLPTPGHSGLFSRTSRVYGPSQPSGLSVQIDPHTFTMTHSKRAQVTVSVTDAVGQPVDDVLVSFLPSEGTVTTETSQTRGGTVTGIFSAAAGSDSPRTAFIIVTVEDIEVTVFVDIVPAVFGR